MPGLLVVAATEKELAGVPEGIARLACGIGPVEAAAATARALSVEHRAAVLCVGIAGARRSARLGIGELVLGSESVFCDAGAVVPSRLEPDAALLAAARAALPDARVLPIGTSARVGGTHAVEVEAMEGFAVLRAAQLAGVPGLEVRAISNEIEEADRGRWRFDEALAALAAALPALAAAAG